MEWIDILTDNGEIVRLETPSAVCDDVHTAIENAMKTQGWFCTNQWQKVEMTYRGIIITRLAGTRIMGVL